MAVETNCHRWMAKRGWTQQQLSVYAGVSAQVVRRLERGEIAEMRASSLVKVAHALGVSVVDLIPAFGYRPAKPQIRFRLHP